MASTPPETDPQPTVPPGLAHEASLRRNLTFSLLTLYGIGVTVGAGIYVLIGATAARAGYYAPFAFVVAALVMAPSAYAFAALARRFPVSAGEAAYVEEGFGSRRIAVAVGLLVALTGTVSAGAITIGAAGYIRELVALPAPVLIVAVLAVLGLVAIWGIRQSVLVAAIITLIEIGGLVIVVAVGLFNFPEQVVTGLPRTLPPVAPAAWATTLSAGLIAFFAFIGFEDMVNVAEEVIEPERNMPRAIFATLAITLVIYFAVTAVAVLLVPHADLAGSEAPLALVFQVATGTSPAGIAAIAILATVNGILVQIIMASRVLYGLSRRGHLPALFGRVHEVTRTPVSSTVVVVAAIGTLALLLPIADLAETTSRFTLVIFALVNAALWRVQRREQRAGLAPPRAERWVPLVGVACCLGFLVSDLL